MSKNSWQTVPVSFTQNYLTSQKTINRLLRLSNINSNDTVIEIGAGKGHITKPLLNKCGRVIASEIDTRLYESLITKFSDKKNIQFVRRFYQSYQIQQSVTVKRMSIFTESKYK